MANINPIRFGVTGNSYYKQDSEKDLAKTPAKEQKAAEKQHKQLGSNEVLGYLSAQNADLIPVKAQKTLDVSKYVTKEQEARIAAFVKGYEADYAEAFNIAANEFPEISEKAAGDLALAYINASY